MKIFGEKYKFNNFSSIAFPEKRMIYLTFKTFFQTRAVNGILDFSGEYDIQNIP